MMDATSIPRRTLYPSIEPYRTGRLRVSPVHEIYYEESGNPEGKPVVFLHGGPGSGTEPTQRCFFNPRRYRIVLFDQRGAGRSTPHASLEDNTTWQLVEDMERLRSHLGIARWQLFGGSWGATLALAYAQRYPERTTELVLRGVFLVRQRELRWFYEDGGASSLFADAWEDYLRVIPEAERGDMLHAYYRRLTDEDPSVRQAAAQAWAQWEGRTSRLLPDPRLLERMMGDRFAVALARIECHYFVNRGFLEQDDQLLRDVQRIRHLPATIVQGRYDVVCPLDSAWALHRVWPEADLRIIPDAGHSAMESGITHELICATDRFAE